MKHYYNEMAQIANALIELGFEYDSSAYSDFNKQKIQVSVHTDYIVLKNTSRSQRHSYGNFSVDKIIERIKELLPKPHWEVDGETLVFMMSNNNTNEYIFAASDNEFMKDYYACAPSQFVHEESDFTILYLDGSVKYAKWIK